MMYTSAKIVSLKVYKYALSNIWQTNTCNLLRLEFKKKVISVKYNWYMVLKATNQTTYLLVASWGLCRTSIQYFWPSYQLYHMNCEVGTSWSESCSWNTYIYYHKQRHRSRGTPRVRCQTVCTLALCCQTQNFLYKVGTQ